MNDDLPIIKDLPDGVIQKWQASPHKVDAVLWDGTAYQIDFIHQWSRGSVYFDSDSGYLTTTTPRGTFEATIGWWVVCGIWGEFKFVPPDIFEETYERAN